MKLISILLVILSFHSFGQSEYARIKNELNLDSKVNYAREDILPFTERLEKVLSLYIKVINSPDEIIQIEERTISREELLSVLDIQMISFKKMKDEFAQKYSEESIQKLSMGRIAYKLSRAMNSLRVIRLNLKALDELKGAKPIKDLSDDDIEKLSRKAKIDNYGDGLFRSQDDIEQAKNKLIQGLYDLDEILYEKIAAIEAELILNLDLFDKNNFESQASLMTLNEYFYAFLDDVHTMSKSRIHYPFNKGLDVEHILSDGTELTLKDKVKLNEDRKTCLASFLSLIGKTQ